MKFSTATMMVLPATMLAAWHAAAAPGQAADPETRAWWAITETLSADGMEGRDTGAAGYDRAARLVADRFKAAGLKPLGDKGSWFQPVAMNEISVDHAEISVGNRPLAFLQEVTVDPSGALPPTVDAPLAYRGYCSAAVLGDVRGKIVICHGVNRPGFPDAAQRTAAVKAAGGIGLATIADPGFAIEPPRWPFAYARTVTLANAAPDTDGFLRLRLKAEALKTAIGSQGSDADGLIVKGSAGEPLPAFDLPDPFHATFVLKRRQIAASNVIGLLPGTDPALAGEAIILSAHLDGYGFGTPVDGDGLYNGTLDDAAYVALLIQLAEQRHGKGYRRPIVFAIFTGEEKGLLGSRWFVANPTLPRASIAANINLDQLRPIFPLDLLTVHALDDTSLGDDARAVAASLNIAVQRDPEPARNLLRRSDQWPFLQAGIPATAFVFGYRPGTESERIYRQWYRTGYHTPKDDLLQRIDWKAAADFNRFFRQLVDRVADKETAPTWKAGSALRSAAN